METPAKVFWTVVKSFSSVVSLSWSFTNSILLGKKKPDCGSYEKPVPITGSLLYSWGRSLGIPYVSLNRVQLLNETGPFAMLPIFFAVFQINIISFKRKKKNCLSHNRIFIKIPKHLFPVHPQPHRHGQRSPEHLRPFFATQTHPWPTASSTSIKTDVPACRRWPRK